MDANRYLIALVQHELRSRSSAFEGSVRFDATSFSLHDDSQRAVYRLGPLAAKVACRPRSDWADLVAEAASSWQHSIESLASTSLARIDRQCLRIRLTTPETALGSVLRPTVGGLIWELIAELPAGFVAVGAQWSNDQAVEAWDVATAITVALANDRLALLNAPGNDDCPYHHLILSGPYAATLAALGGRSLDQAIAAARRGWRAEGPGPSVRARLTFYSASLCLLSPRSACQWRQHRDLDQSLACFAKTQAGSLPPTSMTTLIDPGPMAAHRWPGQDEEQANNP